MWLVTHWRKVVVGASVCASNDSLGQSIDDNDAVQTLVGVSLCHYARIVLPVLDLEAIMRQIVGTNGRLHL